MDTKRMLIACLEDYVEAAKTDGVIDYINDYICHHIVDWCHEMDADQECYDKLSIEFKKYAPHDGFMKDIWEDVRCATYKNMRTTVGWFRPIEEDAHERPELSFNYGPVNRLRLEYVTRLIEHLKS